MKNILLLLFLLPAVWVSAAQNSPYAYIPISLENGLSQPNVTSLLLDSRGSLWIGTRNGLNRMDRQEITVYTSHGHDAAHLPGNEIRDLS
ncbi:MAG: histidine kinase, partial [Bacteroidales bacterium]|nr:histidine kinase [Bacteroidales bacterium]